MPERELVLIVAEGCEGCEAAKRSVGKGVRVLDVTRSDEAARIVRSLRLNRVPVLVELNRADGRVCLLEEGRLRCAPLSDGVRRVL